MFLHLITDQVFAEVKTKINDELFPSHISRELSKITVISNKKMSAIAGI